MKTLTLTDTECVVLLAALKGQERSMDRAIEQESKKGYLRDPKQSAFAKSGQSVIARWRDDLTVNRAIQAKL